MKSNYVKIISKKLDYAINCFEANSSSFLTDPSRNFTRKRKFTLRDLIYFLLSKGNSSSGKELLDYFKYDSETITVSALSQQRDKLSFRALKFIFDKFISSFKNLEKYHGYRLLAVDGSVVSLPYNPNDFETYKSQSNTKGSNELHLNALFDVINKVYLDSVIQTLHEKHERKAAIQMVNKSPLNKVIYLFDRGYEGYNLMEHIENKGFKYLIRVKEPGSGNGILKKLNLEKGKEYNLNVSIKLSYRQTKELKKDPNFRYLGTSSTFDFLDKDSEKTYIMNFRVIGIEVEKDTFQYFVTNLDYDKFGKKDIGEMYHLRWGIETAFRELKHVLGLTTFHSKKVDFIKQEVYAKLIMYNYCELITKNTVITHKPRKHAYQANFTMAIHICKRYFITRFDGSPPDIEALLLKYILPIRKGRTFERKVKPRTSKSFIYRLS